MSKTVETDAPERTGKPWLATLGEPPASPASGVLVRSRHLGLNFEAPFALGRPLTEDCRADVTVSVGPVTAMTEDEPGPVVAEFKPANSSGYTVYHVRGSYLFRFHRLCEFGVSGDGRSILCKPGPSCNDGLLEVLLGGTLTAWLLTLRGLAVLHGSAVRSGEAAVIVAGHSGLGKSTVAALCCAAGAHLIADDVVALQEEARSVACVGLGSELRLRPQAMGIADLFSPPLAERRQTADGRLAIRPPRAAEERNRVSAVVLPRPARDRSDVLVRRLEPMAAVLALLANARIVGLAPAVMQKTYFQTVSALVASVPVLEAWIPWGPPFATETAVELLRGTIAAAASPEKPW